MMKILIIEDNRLVADSIKDKLSSQYTVDIVSSGEEGINQALAARYSIILLDLGLPDMNGFDVCNELRKRHLTAPIIILSGISDINSRIRLLDSGADDYITKPFHSDELRARIAALLRRNTHSVEGQELKIGDLHIDLNKRKVSRAGVAIPLRRKEFDILEYLVENRGHTVTRSMIFDHAWEAGKESWNNTVDVHIKHLRDKIDRPFDSKPLIKTAYGIGYMVDETG